MKSRAWWAWKGGFLAFEDHHEGGKTKVSRKIVVPTANVPMMPG
jgi:hypothetical protein